jgi:lysozyme
MSLPFGTEGLSWALCHLWLEEDDFMELSAAGLELIKKSEGFRSHLYMDVSGFRTIGYGHRVTGRESFPGGIDEAQAATILARDVRQAEQAVGRLVRAALTQGQFDALVDFCFNLGAGRLAASTLLRELNAGRYEVAGEELLCWVYAGGEANAGLKARREAEFQLWTKSKPNATPAAA